MLELETQRLKLAPLSFADDEFILELLNEAGFKRFIGDKGVTDLGDARNYLREGPLASYREHGFGILRVSLAATGETLGMCGLVRRPEFTDPDLGFAFLERHWSNGYARESAEAVLEYAKRSLGLERVIAMADESNAPSVRLLEKLGFVFEDVIRMPGETTEVRRYAAEL